MLRAAAVWLFLTLLVCANSPAQDPKEQFLREYAPKVELLERFYQQTQMDVDATELVASQDTRRARQRYESNGACVRFEETASSAAGAGDASVVVANPDVSFVLAKRAGGDDFSVSAIEGYANQMHSLRLNAKVLFAPYSLYETRLSDYLADPGVVFDSVGEVVEGGQRYVKVRFHEQLDETRRDGTILLSPPTNAIHSYRFDNRSPSTGATVSSLCSVVDYEGESDGFPIPRRIRIWTERKELGGDAKVLQSNEYRVESFEHGEVPLSRFSLTDFGLPAPGGDPPSGSSWTWFLAINAVVILAALGGLFWWFRKR